MFFKWCPTCLIPLHFLGIYLEDFCTLFLGLLRDIFPDAFRNAYSSYLCLFYNKQIYDSELLKFHITRYYIKVIFGKWLHCDCCKCKNLNLSTGLFSVTEKLGWQDWLLHIILRAATAQVGSCINMGLIATCGYINLRPLFLEDWDISTYFILN